MPNQPKQAQSPDARTIARHLFMLLEAKKTIQQLSRSLDYVFDNQQDNMLKLRTQLAFDTLCELKTKLTEAFDKQEKLEQAQED